MEENRLKWNSLSKFILAAVLILAASVYFMQPLALSIKQGLDLQGGTHVVLEAVDTPDAKVDEDAVARVVNLGRNAGLARCIVERADRRVEDLAHRGWIGHVAGDHQSAITRARLRCD